MFFSILKWVILSIVLIALIHYLYSFLIKTLTVPKVRDLIHKPQEQYSDLFKNIHLNAFNAINANTISANTIIENSENADLVNAEDEMSVEMNNYLAGLKNGNSKLG